MIMLNYKWNYSIIKAMKFQLNQLYNFKVYYHEPKKGFAYYHELKF